MKKISVIFSMFLIMLFISFSIFAQTIATANSPSGAKIGKGISIVENAALHFGTMTKPTGAVNVILSTTNVRTATVPANITLLSQAPVHQNATYSVYGDKNNHYVITLPANNVVTIASGSNVMHVDNFIPNSNSQGIGSFSGKLNLLGEDFFTVGATLVLANAQPSGLYSGTFTVTVNYP